MVEKVVVFDVATSTTERERPSSTIADDNGYWLVDDTGKRLIYVRPNATGAHVDAWRQFIGATIRTPDPGQHGSRSPWNYERPTRTPDRTRHSYPGEPSRVY